MLRLRNILLGSFSNSILLNFSACLRLNSLQPLVSIKWLFQVYFHTLKKNYSQNQKLKRFRRIKNCKGHPKSIGKIHKDEHKNTDKNADTFDVEDIELIQNEEWLHDLGNQEVLVFVSAAILLFS